MTTPYGLVYKSDYNEIEKLIIKEFPQLFIFEYFKHYKQMALDTWVEAGRPHVISRDTKIEKQFGNLPYKHNIFPELAYAKIIVIDCKKKPIIHIGNNVFIYTNKNKLKGFVAWGWEDDKITCFEVI